MSSNAPPAPSPSPVPDRSHISIFVPCFTMSVLTTAVVLRFYTRKFILNQLGIDDYFALVSLLVIFGCAFACAYLTHFGLGKHIQDVDPTLIPLYMRTFYVSIVLYNASLMTIKLTFLAQYKRIFSHTSRTHRIMFNCAFAFIISWALSQLLISIFSCHPIEGNWDTSVKAVCVPAFPWWQIQAAGNILTDVMVFLMPIPIIKSLHLPSRQRFVLMGIFSLGLFTVCISIVRIRFLRLYDDFTWENVEASGWSVGEITAGLTCACLPTLRPLITRLVPWIGVSDGGGYATGAGRSAAAGPGAKMRSHVSRVRNKEDIELGSPSSVDSQPGAGRMDGAGGAGQRNGTAVENGTTVHRTGSADSSRTPGDVGDETDNDEWLLATVHKNPVHKTSTSSDDAAINTITTTAAAGPGTVVTSAMATLEGVNEKRSKKKSDGVTASGWRRLGAPSQWMSHETGVQTEITTPAAARTANNYGGGVNAGSAAFPSSAIRVEHNIYQMKEPAGR